ncbi:helicase-exonuclease AddAB subunit AddA [Paenisporosarcina cavernae]|uniref:ATP-dependent helicase/nuclease subunit A n=1 Tax=Paenisporosarcina cavernae TaxID=2320858 RepID=A0A385YYW3_9BACL|nr:helicase-exonuclease AddAB subunit AddA [Paenisporosarcina cavernae]AYC30763.1 helicase-exonuclease AddAB subunit AddA [Paenisporosarcina cavernae]
MIPTKPVDATWTDAQWKAIYAEGTDLLVSAAAGSGKTAVLIQRLIEKMLRSNNPVDVDELLVVTFTNASAAEMRHRLAEALEKAIAANPTSSHLRRQLQLLNKAHISTLHSFCLSVVKTYAYVLDIDPGFRLANETEAALLKDEVLATVLEEAYGSSNPDAVYRLVDAFSSDRDDQLVETLIAKLYEASRVTPDPKGYIASIPEAYEVDPMMTIDDLPYVVEVKSAIGRSIEECLAMTHDALQLALSPEGPAAYEETLQNDTALLQAAHEIVTTAPWEDAHTFMETAAFAKLKSVKKGSCDDEIKKQAQDIRNAVKKKFTGMMEAYYARRPARLLDEIRSMYPLMVTLAALTDAFGNTYEAKKREKGLLDFSDLEHLALAILSKEENGILEPSDIAMTYRKQFHEVLVDEYQDTNILQESILQLIKSGNEENGNLFMVGDVKQSIYRFRLAEPMLFLTKYRTFTEEPMTSGTKIDLNANFRSRAEVLQGTNFIFSQIMSQQVGEIDYDDAAALKPAAPYSEKDEPVEVVVLHTEEEEADEDAPVEVVQEEELKKAQVEARYMIRKIQEWMDSGAVVTDAWSGKTRLLEYRDIVILSRSMTSSADFAEEFKQAGIPLYAELSKGYFDAIEVMIVLNVLRVIDNPYQDIPLASVLRSPFVGLTESELSLIRLSDPKASFYEALTAFIASEKSGIRLETAEKLQRFLLHFSKWRDMARRGSLADLIHVIYEDTFYYDMVGAMPNGKQRQANLRALHDRALSYEKTSFRGLFRFLRFVDRMRKRGDDLGAARAISEKENVVRLMTIHASKGLEFPYVFVAGLGKQFNQMDFNGSYLFDQHFGLAVKAIDPDQRITYTSLPYLAMKEKKQMELKAEEMRVLYVAMTRAKEKLVLLGTVGKLDKTLSNWEQASQTAEDMLPSYIRARAKGFFDWIGPAVSRHMDFAKWRGGSVDHRVMHPSKWSFETVAASDFQGDYVDVTRKVETPLPSNGNDASAEIARKLSYRYDFDSSTTKRSKQSVSELKRLSQLQKEEEPEFFRAAQVKDAMEVVVPRPSFLQESARSLSSAERGTAMHSVMQHLPLSLPAEAGELRTFIDHLVSRAILTRAEADAVSIEQLQVFLQSDLADTMRNAKRVLREIPFTHALDAGDEDTQILQGIIDAVVETNDGKWLLIDYKTDRVGGVFMTDASISREMNVRYGMQLKLYAKAWEEITGISFAETILYLFDTGKTLQLKE